MDEEEVPMSGEEERLIDIVLAEAKKAAARASSQAEDPKALNLSATLSRFRCAGRRPSWKNTAFSRREIRRAAL